MPNRVHDFTPEMLAQLPPLMQKWFMRLGDRLAESSREDLDLMLDGGIVVLSTARDALRQRNDAVVEASLAAAMQCFEAILKCASDAGLASNLRAEKLAAWREGR